MGNSSTKHHLKERPKKNVHWKSAESPAPPGKPILIDGSEIVTIQWDKPKYDGGSPIIGYLVEHRRTGSPHWVRATPLLVPYPELSLSGLEPGWRYQFRIIAENAVGKSEPSELSEPLAVTLQRNAVTAPHFTTEIYETTAVENEKVEFKVNVIGTPQPQISWFKDGFEIFSSRRTKIINENNISILVIHQTSLTDEGEIKCTATNRHGHIVSRARLKVEAPPKIRLPRQYEDGLLIEAEEIVRLKVAIAGRPTPAVVWTQNGEVIKNGGRYEILTNDKFSSLKITNTKRSDRGEYQLKAINKLGEDNAFFLVTVTARPQPPGKVSITMSLGKSVTLGWTSPEDDGGCKIGNYIVEYFRIGWNVWLKAATTRQLTTILNDLIEGSEYKFRVKAENPYGLSDPSEESEILFIPDPKRGITRPSDDENIIKSVNSLNSDEMYEMNRRRHKSPSINIQLAPQVYDSEVIAREMSYGSPSPDLSYRAREEKSLSRATSTELNKPKSEEVKATTEDKNVLEAPRDNHDAVHSSNEFVLVLYPDKESNSDGKRTSFDFDIEDTIAPPPLSLSAPELTASHPSPPRMRRSVSSTELLYERAMARFYQAVAYEEAEKAKSPPPFRRSKSSSIKLENQIISETRSRQGSETRSRQGSFGENERPSSLERKSSLRRRLSGEIPTHFISNLPQKLFNKEEYQREEITIDLDKSFLESEESFSREDYTDDYTDSTASSDESETEQFKRNLMAFTNEKEELETYQPPRIMQYQPPLRDPKSPERETKSPPPRLTSPYSPPEPDQSVEVLTRPLPLPSPDFIPKPILKRPSLEKTPNKKPKNKIKTPNKPERKSLKNLFDREKKTSTGSLSCIKKEKSPVNTKEDEVILTKQEIIKIKSIAAEKKKLESRQNSIEENKVVIDHYSDIVREMGSNRKRTVPLYLSTDELMKAAEKAQLEEEEEQLKNEAPLEIIPPPKTENRSREPKIKVVIKKDREPSIEVESTKTLDKVNLPKRRNLSSSKTRALSKTRKRSMSKSPSALNRVQVPQQNNYVPVRSSLSPPASPEPRARTPEQEIFEEETEVKVKSTITYLTDLSMFLVACWLYIFKDARLALPILALMVYRQIGEAVKDKIPKWMKGKKS